VAFGGYAVYQKAGALLAAVMEKSKPGMMGELTADVTPEQRAEFEATYDKVVKEFREKGFANTITIHSKSFRSLQGKLWVDEFNQEEGAPAAKK
jgi:hypothetical protein